MNTNNKIYLAIASFFTVSLVGIIALAIHKNKEEKKAVIKNLIKKNNSKEESFDSNK